MVVKANIRAEQKRLDRFEHRNKSPSTPTLFAIQLAGILGAELLLSYAKHFAMRRLQVAYKWTGKSISLLMSQSFAVTVTLDIFFERR
jgi:hypothetical protein